MKRSKFMIGALVLSMGLLGTGYAYWTDQLVVNTTVNTGNLDMDFVATTKAEKNTDNNALQVFSGEYNIEGAEQGSDIDGEDKVEFTISNLSPTDDVAGTLIITMKNVGSINTQLSNVSVVSGENDISEHIKFKVGAQGEVSFGGLQEAIIEELGEKIFTSGETSSAQGQEETLEIGVRLAPITADEADEADKNSTQNLADMSFSIDFDFEQANK